MTTSTPFASAEPTQEQEEEVPATQPMPGRSVPPCGLRIRTGLRAGDVYMQNPPGSNDRDRVRHR